MQKNWLDKFLNKIDIQKTHIKSKLPFIWVFGAGGTEISNINNINHILYPEHKEFQLYNNLISSRAKFLQWSLLPENSKNEIVKCICIPEQYHQWADYRSKYTNLMDFELDIIGISQGAIVFSESIGSYVEIGMLACLTELHKNILIISQSRYIQDTCESFFNLGAIAKIKENQIEDITNIWAFENEQNTQVLSQEFNDICEHMLDIITKQSEIAFSNSNKNHISLLIIDLIDLFPRNTKTFYLKALKEFGINIPKSEFDKILSLLKILDLINVKPSGNNEKLEIKTGKYLPCLNYTGKNKPFYRKDFIIEMRG